MNRERGSILVISLMVTLLLLAMGLAAMWVSSSGTSVAGNVTRRHEALTAAQAGLQRAREIAAALEDWDPMLGSASGGTCGATLDDPGGKGNILCAVSTPLEKISVLPPTSTSRTLNPQLAGISYTLYVRNDPMEVAQGNPYDDSDQRVIVRSVGVARDGLSEVALEAVLILGEQSTDVTPGYSQAGLGAAGANAADTQIPNP